MGHSVYYRSCKLLNYYKDLFQSILDYRKVVLKMFLIKNDVDLLTEGDFMNKDIIRLCLELKIILMEHNEGYLDFIKDQEESIIETILNR